MTYPAESRTGWYFFIAWMTALAAGAVLNFVTQMGVV